MNDDRILRLKDPKFYLENFCKVKNKSGGMVPFALKEAQKDIFNTMRTQNRVMILKARQIGFCLSEHTKVLLSSLKWIELKDIKVGDEIIAVDESKPIGRGGSRKMRKAIVEAKYDVYKEAFTFPFLSVVSVAPVTVPLFPLPLRSLALPLKGHQPTSPFEGT